MLPVLTHHGRSDPMLRTDDETDYIDQVVDRSRKLIRTHVWDGIPESRLDDWLGSLRNFDAELLAAYLLDNLCYRSRDQYSALLDALLIDLQVHDESGENPRLLLNVLRGSKILNPACGICVAPVIGHAAPPTKSGPYILRLAQRRFSLHADWLVWPHLLREAGTVTDLYFLDDFCGTGEQFDKFLVGIKLDEFHRNCPSLQVTYLVTTIHQRAIEFIGSKHPYIKLRWAERLGNEHGVLQPECLTRYEVAGFADKIQQQHDAVVAACGLPGKGSKLATGFGGLGLAYAFAHSTPNNTLPIFWMRTASLTPLLDR